MEDSRAARKEYYNQTETNPYKSGDEWWYSHKNLDSSGIHIGYIAVGYVADVVYPNDSVYAGDDTQMRNIYNEGTNSCQNHYTLSTGSLFYTEAPTYTTLPQDSEC